MSHAPDAAPRAPAKILEELAAAVMAADATDDAAIARVLALLDELAGAGQAAAAAAAWRLRAASADVRALAGALGEASEVVARLQDEAARAPRVAPTAPADPGALVLPDWGDEEMLRDFLAAQQGALEELEQAILAMEGGDPEKRAAFERRLHTLKGEAGVLGLDDLEHVCHATEDFLEGRPATAETTDRLLRVRDWMEKAIDGYARMRKPVPGASQLVAEAFADALPAPADADAEAEPALAAAPRPAGRARDEGPVKLRETLKVDLERVDSLVEMIGELVVVESMVVNAPEIGKASSVRVRNCLAQLAKVTRDLQDVGMRMRMVPVAGVFQKMARLVRDLSRKSGKQVRLVTSGESTEMDRSMVEHIADPLVHMIRNAVDHGLEGAEGRAAAGKPPVGEIRLSAYHEGGSVVIEIADDGRGLDRDRIVEKAVEKGLIASAEGMTEAEVNGLIFAPGFSTAPQVTEISGRGVGMDVVKRNIESLRGRVVIASRAGEGTTFKLVLPLTLAIIDGMLVACGAERYIIPTLSIVESIQPDRKTLVSLAQTNEMINLRGELLPLVRLDQLFRLQGAKADPTEALVVVVEGFGRRIGLLVDEVVTQQQVVIKSLGEGLGKTRFLSGAAILSDGKVGLILNVEEIATLFHRSRDFFHERGGEAQPPALPPAEEARA